MKRTDLLESTGRRSWKFYKNHAIHGVDRWLLTHLSSVSTDRLVPRSLRTSLLWTLLFEHVLLDCSVTLEVKCWQNETSSVFFGGGGKAQHGERCLGNTPCKSVRCERISRAPSRRERYFAGLRRSRCYSIDDSRWSSWTHYVCLWVARKVPNRTFKRRGTFKFPNSNTINFIIAKKCLYFFKPIFTRARDRSRSKFVYALDYYVIQFNSNLMSFSVRWLLMSVSSCVCVVKFMRMSASYRII